MADENVFFKAVKNLGVLVQAAEEAGETAMKQLGVEAVSEMKQILSQPGQGRVYTRGSVEHQASAPGDPPAVDRGLYRASWDWAVRRAGVIFELLLGTDDERGPWLEFGTSDMEPRPHLRVLMERIRNSRRVSEVIGRIITELQTRAARSLGG